jgi:parallel beta-helix repeat protein
MTSNLLATIRKARLSLSLLATISSILLSASPAKAGTAITITQSACPIVIDQPGTYFLAKDVGPCAPGADGIDISASNVTLQLAGHTITGTATAGTCDNALGISIFSSGPMLTNVNVLGSGTINNFALGFDAANSANSSVKFVKVNANCPDLGFAEGFEIDPPGGHWTLQGNVVQGPGDTTAGIVLFRVNNNTLVLNNVNDSVSIADSSNNVIVNNTASDNFGGIFLITVTLGSNNNQVSANTTSNNQFGGLTIFGGSVGNNISGNKSFNNTPFDMEDDNPNCGTNTWQGNHFTTASQSCIH